MTDGFHFYAGGDYLGCIQNEADAIAFIDVLRRYWRRGHMDIVGNRSLLGTLFWGQPEP
jgi:hypothetical protein